VFSIPPPPLPHRPDWFLRYNFAAEPAFRFVNLQATRGVLAAKATKNNNVQVASGGRGGSSTNAAGGLFSNDSSQLAFVFAHAGFEGRVMEDWQDDDDALSDDDADEDDGEEDMVEYRDRDGKLVLFRAAQSQPPRARLRRQRKSSPSPSDSTLGGASPSFSLLFQTTLPPLFSLVDDPFYALDGSACPSTPGAMHALALQLDRLRRDPAAQSQPNGAQQQQPSGGGGPVAGDKRLLRYAVESILYSLRHGEALLQRMAWSVHYVAVSARGGPLLIFVGSCKTDVHIIVSCSARMGADIDADNNSHSIALQQHPTPGLAAGSLQLAQSSRAGAYSFHDRSATQERVLYPSVARAALPAEVTGPSPEMRAFSNAPHRNAASPAAAWLMHRSKLYVVHLPLDMAHRALQVAAARMHPLPPTLGDSVQEAMRLWEARHVLQHSSHSSSARNSRPASAAATVKRRKQQPGSRGSRRPQSAATVAPATRCAERGIVAEQRLAAQMPPPPAQQFEAEQQHQLVIREDEDDDDTIDTYRAENGGWEASRPQSASGGLGMQAQQVSDEYFGGRRASGPSDAQVAPTHPPAARGRPQTATARLQSPSSAASGPAATTTCARVPLRTHLADGASVAAAAQTSTLTDVGSLQAGRTHEISYVSEQLLEKSYFAHKGQRRVEHGETKSDEKEQQQSAHEALQPTSTVRVRVGQAAVDSSSRQASAAAAVAQPSGSLSSRSAPTRRPQTATASSSSTVAAARSRTPSPILSFFGQALAGGPDLVALVLDQAAAATAASASAASVKPKAQQQRPQSARLPSEAAIGAEEDVADDSHSGAIGYPERPASAHAHPADQQASSFTMLPAEARLRQIAAVASSAAAALSSPISAGDTAASSSLPKELMESMHTAEGSGTEEQHGLVRNVGTGSPRQQPHPQLRSQQRPQSAFVRSLTGRDIVISGRVEGSSSARPASATTAAAAAAGDNNFDVEADQTDMLNLGATQSLGLSEPLEPLSFTSLVSLDALTSSARGGPVAASSSPAALATARQAVLNVPAGHPLSFNRPMSALEAAQSLGATVLASVCARGEDACGVRLYATLAAGQSLWRCVWCRKAVYCSSSCMSEDWVSGIHQRACAEEQIRLRQLSPTSATRALNKRGSMLSDDGTAFSLSSRRSSAGQPTPASTIARAAAIQRQHEADAFAWSARTHIGGEEETAWDSPTARWREAAERAEMKEAEAAAALSSPRSLSAAMAVSAVFPAHPVLDIQRRARATHTRNRSRGMLAATPAAFVDRDSSAITSSTAVAPPPENQLSHVDHVEQQRAYAVMYEQLEASDRARGKAAVAAADYTASRNNLKGARSAKLLSSPPVVGGSPAALLRGYVTSLSPQSTVPVPRQRGVRPSSASSSSLKRTGGGGMRAPHTNLAAAAAAGLLELDAGETGNSSQTTGVAPGPPPPEITPSDLHFVPLSSTTLLYATTRAAPSKVLQQHQQRLRPRSASHVRVRVPTAEATAANLFANAPPSNPFGRGPTPSIFAPGGGGGGYSGGIDGHHLDHFLRQAQQARAMGAPVSIPSAAAGAAAEHQRVPVPLVSFKQALAKTRPTSAKVRLASNGREGMLI
jgi:hypothetical protein